MSERIQTAIGIDRQFAFEVEETLEHIVPRSAPRAEPQVFVQDEFGRGEAIMHLGKTYLFARIGNTCLRVRVARGGNNFGEGGEVILLGEWTFRRSGDER